MDSESTCVLPAKYIPEEAVGREKVGLFIDPEDVTEETGKIIVHSAIAAVVLHPFIQKSKEGGRVDEATRIPLAIRQSGYNGRRLYRTEGIGVRPLVRILNLIHDH